MRTQRKISFFSLRATSTETHETVSLKQAFDKLYHYLDSLDFNEKKGVISNDKFMFLDNHQETDDQYIILFKSAKIGYRAPLLDKNTLEERDNPKRISEGELVKTHCLLNVNDDEGILYMESGLGLITIKNFIRYINSMIRKHDDSNDEKMSIIIEYDVIARNDFLEALNNLNRSTVAEVFVDKQILGSDALNYSQRIEEVKQNIKIIVNAERGLDIKNTIIDFFNKLNSGRSVISRIRVRGKGDDDSSSLIDTNFFQKREYVLVEKNDDTGEIVSADMFQKLREIDTQ